MVDWTGGFTPYRGNQLVYGSAVSLLEKKWLEQNSFPNERFKGPSDLPTPPQPSSKEGLLDQFNDLMIRVQEMARWISESDSKGRAQHPGHGYLNAVEWFQYAEMHILHHFRQKDRIDEFLYR